MSLGIIDIRNICRRKKCHWNKCHLGIYVVQSMKGHFKKFKKIIGCCTSFKILMRSLPTSITIHHVYGLRNEMKWAVLNLTNGRVHQRPYLMHESNSHSTTTQWAHFGWQVPIHWCMGQRVVTWVFNYVHVKKRQLEKEKK